MTASARFHQTLFTIPSTLDRGEFAEAMRIRPRGIAFAERRGVHTEYYRS
ncbi:hypothetical protein C731_2379 [Mycolicibacterium hassiacum DSM 44199]|uniref:Uncharacterized protein n=1 Tax=Mycolicibacterium hassiacum (strain DSM 44199 / CIP 105218 / JCM 12690 / 3849) TaxID=1122247 RepID=K5BG00_MYCHD|nr:hypothetical protein C731_2379 [Mycolicibacterium hassiacum DSM 44199]